MSSEEEELTSPALPKDSDRGSSVSSDLQVIIQKSIYNLNAQDTILR